MDPCLPNQCFFCLHSIQYLPLLILVSAIIVSCDRVDECIEHPPNLLEMDGNRRLFLERAMGDKEALLASCCLLFFLPLSLTDLKKYYCLVFSTNLESICSEKNYIGFICFIVLMRM